MLSETRQIPGVRVYRRADLESGRPFQRQEVSFVGVALLGGSDLPLKAPHTTCCWKSFGEPDYILLYSNQSLH